jgi:hypothetical protein
MLLLILLVGAWPIAGEEPHADLSRLQLPLPRWEIVTLLLILALAAALRLTNLGYAEFHGDEARAILRAAAVVQGYDDVLFLHKKGPAEILLPTAIFAALGHAGVQALVSDLNRVYRALPAMHRRDHDGDGFTWLSWQDEAHSTLSFVRKDGEAHAIVILNFTPVPRQGYRVGVPRPGRYREVLNSDSAYYGGSNLGNTVAETEPVPCMEQAQSIVVTLPPLAGIVLVPDE